MREWVRRGHRWLELTVGLYLAVLGLTGSVLVFRRELERLTLPHLSVVTVGSERPSARALLEAAERWRPGAGEGLSYGQRADDAAYAFWEAPSGNPMQSRTLALDPYTGRTLGEFGPTDSFVGFCLALHVFLLIGIEGLLVNTAGGILAGLALLSGLWLWWPKTFGALRARFRVRRRSLKTVAHDLHNAVGGAGFVALLGLALTGATFGIDPLVRVAVYAATGTPEDSAPPQAKAVPAAMELDALLARAEQAAGARVVYFQKPKRAKEPMYAYADRNTGWLAGTAVYLDPADGRVLKVEDERRSPRGTVVMTAMHDLHFGQWGGPGVKILYALVGLLPSLLFVTGFLKWRHAR